MTKTILVTGGAGYIGSHAAVELLNAGYGVVIVDNLVNSSPVVIDRIQAITGLDPIFHRADCRNRDALRQIFSSVEINSVIHFAGLKAVGESVAMPLAYYENNITATLALLEVMAEYGVKNIVFSSSATVYGNPPSLPIREDFPLQPANPYGQTKLMIEQILKDVQAADSGWHVVLLRYFNPGGAHASGLIGEDPLGIPNNLLPYVTQVAVGKLEFLRVFGNDYDTADGTGVRDYIHVVDLALGHLKAIEMIDRLPLAVFNLGTGRGYSVLEVIRAFEQVSGRRIPCKIVDRRPGDIAACFADPALANDRLGWKADRDICDILADAWRWQAQNPRGYCG